MKKRKHTMLPIEPLLLTIPQVAALLELGRTKVYDLIEREGLPSIKLGTARRIPVKSLQEWLAQREGKNIA